MKYITTLLLALGISSSFVFAQTTSTFSFNINGTIPAGFSQAVNIAGQRWSNYLSITVPIKVNIFTFNYGGGIPASAITVANGRQNFTNAPVPNVLYTSSLANQLAGTELNVGEYDMDIYVNMYESYYYGTGKPSFSQTDFISLMMHEIGHGLGFYSTGYVDDSNIGSFGNVPLSALYIITPSFAWRGQDGVPCIYDKFIVKPSQNNLLGMAPNNTTALGDSIRLKANYFNGPTFANNSNGGNKIRLSGGTGAFSLGVDLLHTHNSVPKSIMSYAWGAGDTVRRPANCELGILREIGWNVTIPTSIEDEIKHTTFECFPNPSNDIIHITSDNMESISIYNIQSQLVYEEKYIRYVNEVVVDTKQLPAGIYYVSVLFNNTKERITKKISIISN